MKFKIENYENMTIEEKLKALEAYEPDMSGFVEKSVFDKKASEAAELNRKLKTFMTEEEAAKVKEAEERAALEARVKELETERTISAYIASYLSMGYDEKLANDTAKALAADDMETVFKNQKVHIENTKKSLKAELLKATPRPDGGSSTETITKEQFAKMGYSERMQVFEKNKELYKELNNGGN